MSLCPKCRTPNPKGATECDGCGVVFTDIRRSGTTTVNRNCPWNDHGQICGAPGTISDSTSISAPWYCSRHWRQLNGYAPRAETKKHVSFRERWYQEHGKPYEPPKIKSSVGFKCVGIIKTDVGQDWDEVAA